MTSARSWLLAVAKVGVPHLLALLIALSTGWCVYQHGQDQKIDRLLSTLLADSAENLTLLLAVIERESWSADSIDVRIADPSVAQAILSDATVFTSDLDRGFLLALLSYRQSIEAARWIMEFMRDRFLAQGHLSMENLETLDRICRNAIGATRVLQSLLDPEMRVRKIKLGTRSEAIEVVNALKREVDRAESEVRRPPTK